MKVMYVINDSHSETHYSQTKRWCPCCATCLCMSKQSQLNCPLPLGALRGGKSTSLTNDNDKASCPDLFIFGGGLTSCMH